MVWNEGPGLYAPALSFPAESGVRYRIVSTPDVISRAIHIGHDSSEVNSVNPCNSEINRGMRLPQAVSWQGQYPHPKGIRN